MASTSIGKNTAFAAADMATATACAVVTSILVGRFLGPAKLGHYNYVLWIANFSVALANFGVPSAVGKYMAEFLGLNRPGLAAATVRAGFRYQLGSGVLVLGVGCGLALLFEERSHLAYVLPVVASLPLTMLMAISTHGNMAMERFEANAVPSICGSIVNLTGVLLALHAGWDLPGLAGALFSSKLADSGLRYLLFRRFFTRRVGPTSTFVVPNGLPEEERRRFVRFCLQATVLVLINLVVWNRSEMFFLKAFCDIRQVAFFSVAFGVVLALVNAAEPFASAVSARLLVQYRRDPEESNRTAILFLRLQALVIVPLAFGLAALARPVLLLTYGRAYEPAVPVLTAAALLCAPAALATPARKLIAAADRQQFSVWWGLLSAVATLLLDWILVSRSAALGGALANGLSQALAVSGFWLYLSRVCGIRLPYRRLLLVVLSGAGMALTVRVATAPFSPVTQLLGGVPLGVLTYAALIRALRVLAPEDVRALSSLMTGPPALRFGVKVALALVVSNHTVRSERALPNRHELGHGG